MECKKERSGLSSSVSSDCAEKRSYAAMASKMGKDYKEMSLNVFAHSGCRAYRQFDQKHVESMELSRREYPASRAKYDIGENIEWGLVAKQCIRFDSNVLD